MHGDVIPSEVLLEAFPEAIRTIANELRAIVRRVEPGAVERVRTGWRLIGYDLPLARGRAAFFCYVAPERGHAHVGFPQGVAMSDPERILLGAGVTRRARWLTFQPGDVVEAGRVEALLREAATVARLSVGERRLRAYLAEERKAGPPAAEG